MVMTAKDACTLRDACMEVIYTRLHQTPQQIADTTIPEDANAVGLSILSDLAATSGSASPTVR
jgi:methylmalonyl-CoA mutase cobalamin-binding domain/chain